MDTFNDTSHLPKSEVQIYTWPDASLRELTELLQEVDASAKAEDSRLEFAFIYPGRDGKMIMRRIGSVLASKKGEGDKRTLRGCFFQPGDYLSVCISLLHPRHS